MPSATKACSAVKGPGSSTKAMSRLASPAASKYGASREGPPTPRASRSDFRNFPMRAATIDGARLNSSLKFRAASGVTEECLLSFTPNSTHYATLDVGCEAITPAFRNAEASWLTADLSPLCAAQSFVEAARILEPHTRNTFEDRKGQPSGAADELLRSSIVLERCLGQRTDKNLEQLGIDLLVCSTGHAIASTRLLQSRAAAAAGCKLHLRESNKHIGAAL